MWEIGSWQYIIVSVTNIFFFSVVWFLRLKILAEDFAEKKITTCGMVDVDNALYLKQSKFLAEDGSSDLNPSRTFIYLFSCVY